jgi:hypothetical protein
MLALLGNIHVLIVDPAPAVADHIVIRALIAATISGCRASAIATPKTVSGSPRWLNSRWMRQNPARLPYS